MFRRLLARIEAGAAFDAGYHRCPTLMRLGRSLAGPGRAGEAEAVYRGELAALAGLGAERRACGGRPIAAHTGLADVLTDLGRFAEARAEYEDALNDR